MEIRKMQKTGDLLMQRTPFNRVVREIVSKIHTRDYKIRYTADFFLSLQAFVEDRTVDLMKRANLLSAHANRETVFEKDITLACELNDESYKVPTVESYIPGAALRKMALRAGIKRFGDGSSDAYRNYIVGLLKSCLTDITLCAYHHKVQTLNTKIFSEAMAMRGIFPSIIPRKRKVGRKGTSNSSTIASAVEDTQSRIEAPMLSDIEEEPEEEAV
jgi:histone H3/H4